MMPVRQRGFIVLLLMVVAGLSMVAAVEAQHEHGVDPNAATETVAGLDHEAEGEHGGTDLGAELPLWSIIPFIGILLSIADFPLVAPHFWHQHFPKICALWADCGISKPQVIF